MKIGKTVQMAFVDQHRDELANEKTVGGRLRRPRHDQHRQVHDGQPRLLRPLQLQRRRPAEEGRPLSGGERGRLHLAKTLLQGATCCCWTNPRTTSTWKRALEDALLEFAGSDGDQPRPLVPGPHRHPHPAPRKDEGKWVFFDGNYQEYEADKRKRLGEEGARPHRVR